MKKINLSEKIQLRIFFEPGVIVLGLDIERDSFYQNVAILLPFVIFDFSYKLR